MIDVIFTHDSVESALRTRDLLHECLKGCDAYVNNDIILSDSNSECKPGDWTFKFKTESGKELTCKHCIALLIAGGNKNGSYRQVIHVSDTKDLFPTLLNGLSIPLDSIAECKDEIQKRSAKKETVYGYGLIFEIN